MIDQLTQNAQPTLYVNETTGDEFLIYGQENGIKIEIRYQGETLWMTQAQIAALFGRDVGTVSRHIKNILEEGELDEDTCLQKMQKSMGRPTSLYSLDMVISVGYRISSKQATMFRKWATDKLVQFATRGFVIDKQRLKDPDVADRLAELRETIREIRADEANVYRELRSICAMCQDYDGASSGWRDFYMRTQAKLMWAVTSHTPSEIIAERANATSPNMGLQTWAYENIRKSDTTVSKNYLGESEVKELNRLTTILLDIFEDQTELGKLVLMADAENLLDQQLKQLSRPVLKHGGQVKTKAAHKHAELEYEKFNEERKRLRHEQADATIAKLKQEEKALPRRTSKKKH